VQSPRPRSCSRRADLRLGHMDTVALPFSRLRLTADKPRSRRYPKQINTLGDHILTRRLDLQLTRKQASAILRTNDRTLENWERQRTRVAVRHMPAIIAFLGYNPGPPGLTQGQPIQGERIARGLSKPELAMAAGIDQATVTRLEADTLSVSERPAGRS
jgi:transcriptional regulator with XRE-family HTH domain